jgi:transposase
MARLGQEKRDQVFALLRKDPKMTAAAIKRETGVSEMTIANWKREGEQGGGTAEPKDGEQKKPVNLREQVQTLEAQLALERLKNKWLRRYARADSSEKLEAEISYLLARLKVFGDEEALRLADEQQDEDEDEDKGEHNRDVASEVDD